MKRKIENNLYNIFARIVGRLPGARALLAGKCAPVSPTKNRPLRLLFVCKGNICRSCYAEVGFRDLCAKNGLKIECQSAGLLTDFGKSANPQAISEAGQRGLDLSSHRTTPFSPSMVDNVDCVIAMEPWQVRDLKHRTGKFVNVCLLGGFGMLRGANLVIQDPYGKNASEFRKCFDEIDACLEELLWVLKNIRD